MARTRNLSFSVVNLINTMMCVNVFILMIDVTMSWPRQPMADLTPRVGGSCDREHRPSVPSNHATSPEGCQVTSTERPPHFLFEPEHDEFRQIVRQFVEREVNPHADEWERAERIPKELFLHAGELDFFAHGTSEQQGGRGIDCRLAIVMAEELSKAHARGVGMGFGAHNEIAKPHLVRFGTPQQQEKYLGAMIAGRIVGALGVTEPSAGSNVAGIQTTATRSGGGWLLKGEKIFITNTVNADLFFHCRQDGPSGGTSRHQHVFGRTRPVSASSKCMASLAAARAIRGI